jgi:hypothetical protein
MEKSIFFIYRTILFSAIFILPLSILNAQVTEEDGDWSKKIEILQNTPEAQLMVRTGDIDNLGFGWPANFNPFSGNNTPKHVYPWTADTTDPAGTDRIMVITSYQGTPPRGQDGYTTYTSRPDNSVRPITLSYNLDGMAVNSAILQIFVDDFQAGLWGASYIVTINNVRANFMESIINSLMQTGPIGKLISIEIPEDYLYLIERDSLSVVFDDFTTGAGDGYAIDFVKLLINPESMAQVGTINGTIYDQNTYQPIKGVRVVANGIVSDTTDINGNYSIEKVLAGVVNVQTFKEGYGSKTSITELTAGSSQAIIFYLQSPAPEVTSIVPTDSTFNVELNIELSIKFNMDMDTLTFNDANFILSSADSSIPGSFIRTDSMMIFVPNSYLADDTEYRAELTTGVKSKSGISLSENFIWVFSTGVPVSIYENHSPVSDFSILEQNYPNPFNPITHIKFRLLKSQNTTLTICNTLGQKIATLFNQPLIAGIHEIEFNAQNLPSGIYYYQLTVGEHREMKKMVLLK